MANLLCGVACIIMVELIMMELPELDRRGPAPVMLGQQRQLPGTHRRCFSGLGMVVPQDVQHTVDDEQRKFVFVGPGMNSELRTRDCRREYDVTE